MPALAGSVLRMSDVVDLCAKRAERELSRAVHTLQNTAPPPAPSLYCDGSGWGGGTRRCCECRADGCWRIGS